MHVLPYTEARSRLKQIIEDVCWDHEPTILTRQRREPAVLLSLRDYNGMLETLYFFSTPNNAQRLMDSIAQAEAGEFSQHELINNVEAEESDGEE